MTEPVIALLENDNEAQLEVLVLSAVDKAVGFTWVLRHADRSER